MYKLFILTLAFILTAFFLSGCDLLAVKGQQQKIAGYCQLYGSVKPEKDSGKKIIVVLLKFKGGEFQNRKNWSLFDHFVNDRPGKWYFSTSPGSYLVTAFEDTNDDLIFQPGEPAIPLDPKNLLHCSQGEVKKDINLLIHPQDRINVRGPVDIAKAQIRNSMQQFDISLGQVTKTGEIVKLTEPRFSDENAKQGMWRPLDFLIEGNAGLYFLEPYSAQKIPILFVHGINGSPRNFSYLTEHIDRAHFQPWLFYYPSGAHLENIAKRLNQIVEQLQGQYKFKKLVVIAHSMGGLVARNFILKSSESSRDNLIPLFITLATPWDGHAAAKLGAENLPAPVYSWIDMAPGSPFLTGLFHATETAQAPRRRLPQEIANHLFFTFIDNEAGDGTVSLASELRPEAQEEATRLYGYQKSHTGILTTPEMVKTVNGLLESLR
jgi:pimeloyl-ACP methyl ester carboxylesterase